MGFIGETWRLVGRRTGGVVGEILVEDADFPWLHGRFTAHTGFAELRPLFERELALVDRIDDAYEQWEEAYEAITEAVALTAPGNPVADFLLHIDGETAWFRWTERPSGED
ncbi:hypothetical protein ACFOZ0_20825 [Streptomyces yaanensis]|uniref:Uncharacterized protein n=1 Tax=Streptomyces yaanensis TaxID=1142239 RepID=A0ABV7SH22_9ACTN|nr:hypothetical protein [Streptomyces sp. CGMCC 4.7035]WNB97712.1 hypothetical protein Q2K21_06275 [Streptomyces sp. CGMCC 4.7035]